MAARKKNKKHDRKKKRRQPPVRASLPAGLFSEDVVVIENPAGQAKMSEVLMQFIEPYPWRTKEELDRLLSVATLAWNVGMFPASERNGLVEQIVKTFPPAGQAQMRAFVTEMVQRKLSRFAGIQRIVVSYELTMLPTGPYLAVMSSIAGE